MTDLHLIGLYKCDFHAADFEFRYERYFDNISCVIFFFLYDITSFLDLIGLYKCDFHVAQILN